MTCVNLLCVLPLAQNSYAYTLGFLLEIIYGALAMFSVNMKVLH